MDNEIEETEEGFGKTLAKVIVLNAGAAFGVVAGFMTAGWLASRVKTNIEKIEIKTTTKSEDEE